MSHTIDTIDIVGIIVMGVGVLILSPILAYSLYTFEKIKDSDFIKYRNKRLVYAMNILSILSFCTKTVFIIVTQVLHIPNVTVPEYICFIAAYLFIFGFYILFIIKTWLSYYLREYHRKLVELAWSKDVNPATSKAVNNEWIVKYKHKLGNYKYLIKIICLPFLILLTIQIIIDFQVTSAAATMVSMAILCILLIFIFIVLLILYFKIFDFNDIYHIKKEIQYQTIIALLIVLLSTGALMSHIFDSTHMDKNRRMEWLFSVIISYISLFSISLISTAFPVYLYKKNLNVSQLRNSQSMDERNNNKKHHFLDSMLAIISNEYAFKAFMTHLIKEYSTENMLFILELVQIKHTFQLKYNNVLKLPKCIDFTALSDDNGAYDPKETNIKIASSEKVTVDFNIQNNLNLQTAPKSPSPSSPETMSDTNINFEDIYSNVSVRSKSNSEHSNNEELQSINTYLFKENGHIFCKLVLPGHLPQSAIINAYANDFFVQMECLYRKYICKISKHEINIGYKSRIGLINLFENNVKNHVENELDLLNIFDEAAIEILKLAFNSFSRFKETCAYKEIKEKIKINKNKNVGIPNVSVDFGLDVVHTEDSYDKICAIYPTNSSSLQSISEMSNN